MEPNVEVMEEAQSGFGTAVWPTLHGEALLIPTLTPMTQGLVRR